jgi:hypothetical protein
VNQLSVPSTDSNRRFCQHQYPVLRAAGYHLVTMVSRGEPLGLDVTVVPYQRNTPAGDPFCPAPTTRKLLPPERATSLSGFLVSQSTHPPPSVLIVCRYIPHRQHLIAFPKQAAHMAAASRSEPGRKPPRRASMGGYLGLINTAHMDVHRP